MAEPAEEAAEMTTPARVRVCAIPSMYANRAIPVVLNITATICNFKKENEQNSSTNGTMAFFGTYSRFSYDKYSLFWITLNKKEQKLFN